MVRMVKLPRVLPGDGRVEDAYVNPANVSTITGADDLDICTITFGKGPGADHMDIGLNLDDAARRLTRMVRSTADK